MIAEHCRAEVRSESATKERVLQVWKLPENKPDNHFFRLFGRGLLRRRDRGAGLSELRINAPAKRRRRKTEFRA